MARASGWGEAPVGMGFLAACFATWRVLNVPAAVLPSSTLVSPGSLMTEVVSVHRYGQGSQCCAVEWARLT